MKSVTEKPRPISEAARRRQIARLCDLDPASLAAHFGVGSKTILADLSALETERRGK